MALPLIVGITGATGVVYGIELLKVLKRLGVPSHLIVSEVGIRTLGLELDMSLADARALADATYSNKDLAAAVASGSFRTRGMVIAPCSVKTLSGIANAYDENLMICAADVTLKERRPLVLMFRESPLHLGHLRLMVAAAEIGAIMLPPMPAFYHRPTALIEVVHQGVGRVLDQFGIEHDLSPRWTGP